MHTHPQFLSQPFVVGERVTLLTASGAVAITGTVEAVYPMRTILRDDTHTPSMLPNKARRRRRRRRPTLVYMFI